jgi:molybdenum cofactor guanylyltransferase
MGRDKATIEIDGVTLAGRTAALLAGATTLSLEVGPGVSGLASVREDPPGEGPLAAILAGRDALVARGLSPDSACIVVSCDLPTLTASVLRQLSLTPGDRSVLPVIDGTAQPLCARWSAEDLDAAALAFAGGERSLRRLPERSNATLLDESAWGVETSNLRDADTPEDLASIGIILDAATDQCAFGTDERPPPPPRR